MQAISPDRCKLIGFAINRTCQPTRIERELLAQVFELAARGVTTQSVVDDNVGQARDHASHHNVEHEPVIRDVTDCRDRQNKTPEPVA